NIFPRRKELRVFPNRTPAFQVCCQKSFLHTVRNHAPRNNLLRCFSSDLLRWQNHRRPSSKDKALPEEIASNSPFVFRHGYPLTSASNHSTVFHNSYQQSCKFPVSSSAPDFQW